MAYEFKLKHRIEFADTDMAGIMHFSNFFRLMEVTEHAFYRSLGFSVHPKTPEGSVIWPRVHASCDFQSPLYFEDEVEVHLLIKEKKPKLLSQTFIFKKTEEGKTLEVARGSLIIVCAILDPVTKKMKAVPIPASIADKIEGAPAKLFTMENNS